MINTINNILLNSQCIIIMNYFRELFNGGPIKFIACLLSGIVGWFSSYFAPIWSIILVTCFFILIDTVLGTKVSLSNGGTLESRRLRKTINKLGNAILIITCCHLMDVEILTSINAHLVEAFSGIVCGVELWSMIESLQSLDPTGPWKVFSKFIKSKGEKYLDITIDKEDLPKVEKLIKKVK